MSKTQVNPKLFHCSKTEILAKNIANSFGADLGKIITSIIVMVNFSHLMKNL